MLYSHTQVSGWCVSVIIKKILISSQCNNWKYRENEVASDSLCVRLELFSQNNIDIADTVSLRSFCYISFSYISLRLTFTLLCLQNYKNPNTNLINKLLKNCFLMGQKIAFVHDGVTIFFIPFIMVNFSTHLSLPCLNTTSYLIWMITVWMTFQPKGKPCGLGYYAT